MKVKNAADEEQVKAARESEKRQAEDERNDTLWVLSQPAGRRFVWRYLGHCGVFKTSFTGNSTTFYNEGMRNIGLRLLADVEAASLDNYLVMRKENTE